jgi:hypothetical protein
MLQKLYEIMNDEFIKDLVKASKTDNDISTGRRYEPKGGMAKHRAMIDKDTKMSDKYSNLPFTFGNISKSAPSMVKLCEECMSSISCTKNSIGAICNKCNKFVKVIDAE